VDKLSLFNPPRKPPIFPASFEAFTLLIRGSNDPPPITAARSRESIGHGAYLWTSRTRCARGLWASMAAVVVYNRLTSSFRRGFRARTSERSCVCYNWTLRQNEPP